MDDALWQEKLSPPRLRAVLHRDRLHRRLRDESDAGLVWISAPAGSGKTTLASDFALRFDGSSLWYRLDSGDQDPACLFRLLRQGATGAAGGPGIAPPEFSTAVLPNAQAFARQFFGQLAVRLGQPALVVLDDYHELPADAPLHDLLAAGLEAIPPGLLVLVLSRTNPHPGFVRLRCGSRLARLTWEDLRLTRNEAADIIGLRFHEADPELAARLYERSEGWAAGLVLLCEQMRDGISSTGAPGHLGKELIFDYLAGEILCGIEGPDRDFLLASSLAPYLTSAIADALSDQAPGARVLDGLQRRNLFLFVHSGQEQTLRYHALFRDFLRRRAEQELPPAVLTELRRRIASLLLDAGDTEEALHLLIDAGDWARAEEVLLDAAPRYVQGDRFIKLNHWVRAFPTIRLDQCSWLQYWLAISCLPLDPRQAHVLFEQAHTRFQSEGNRSGVLLACAGVIDAVQLAFADCRSLGPWVERLHGALVTAPEPIAPEIEARAACALFVGALSGPSDHPKLPVWAERAKRLGLVSEDANLRMQTAYAAISYHLWMGEPESARLILEEMQSWSSQQGATPLMVLTTLTATAMHQWLTGRFDEALDSVSAGLALADESGVIVWSYMLACHGAAAAMCNGDLLTARRFLDQLGAVRERARPLDLAYFHYLAAWWALIGDRPDEAAAHDARAQDIGGEALPLVAQGVLHFSRTEVARALARPAEALAGLSQLDELASGTGSHLLRMMAGVERALLQLDGIAAPGDDAGPEAEGAPSAKPTHTATRKPTCDAAALAETLDLARSLGLVNFFGWRHSEMTRIALVALEQGIQTDFVIRLVRERGLRPPQLPLAPDTWPWRLRICTLGRFALFRDGEPLTLGGKGQRKPISLLQTLLAYGGCAVSTEQLSEALWPDADSDASRRAFDTTLHRLRRLLDVDGILTVENGRLSLAPHLAWVDTWALDALVDGASGWLRETDTQPRAESLTELLGRIENLYRGAFLADDSDEPWVLAQRERLQQRALRLLRDCGLTLERIGAWQEATACYSLAIEIEPLAEAYYQRLMTALHTQGCKAEALATYERCREAMISALGVVPSPQTIALHRHILTSGSD